MAVVLGQKLVQDTKKFDDFAVGITLPIQIGNTAFNQSFKTFEQASSNIKNLLLTKKGERVMQPEFGSGLQELLFDFNDDSLAGKIEETITTAIETWLPYITIQQIDVEASNYDKDTNSVKISIKFSILGNAELNTVTIEEKI
jgi:phage baseplate assembly protein W